MDIFSPPPGESEAISQFERDSSRDTKIEDVLVAALGVARAQRARWWELRVAADLARLLRDRGRPAEARDLLAPVHASFAEGFAFPDLAEARALLEDLDAAR